MSRQAMPGDVDGRGFACGLVALAPVWELAAQQASCDRARCEREHAVQDAELERMCAQEAQQLEALAGAIDPARRANGLLFLSHSWQRRQAQQRAVQACAAAAQEARRAEAAARCRLDSLLHLQQDAVDRYAAQQRRRATKDADDAWLAARSRLHALPVGER